MNRKIQKAAVLLVATLAFMSAPSNAQTTSGTQGTTPQQAQRPRGRGPGRAGAANQTTTPNVAAAQDEAVDTGSDVVQLRPQDLSQNPLRVGIHDAMQQGLQAAKPNPSATLTLHTVAGNSAQTAVPNTESTSTAGAANAEANVASSAKQNGASNANGLQNAVSNPQNGAAAAGQPPPQYRLAITAMQTAMGDLSKAGNKWGGHKGTAVSAIHQALTACGGPPNQPGTANSAAVDPSSAMQDAIAQLTNAKNHLGKATNDWGGRREKAISAIDQALSELQAGVDYAKSHTN